MVEGFKVTEEAPLKPSSPYARTKYMMEMILQDFCHAYGMHGIALRYFNPIGAHPSALIGELPNGVPNNLLPFVAQTAAGIRKKLKVFGDDYNTPDGSCIRDYINVVDLAKAHIAAMRRILSGETQTVETYNVGTGRGLSVLEILNAFETVNDVKVPHEIVGRRAGDIEQVWADPSHANKMLKWKAETSLEDTVRSIWKWQLHLAELEEAQNKVKGGKMLGGS